MHWFRIRWGSQNKFLMRVQILCVVQWVFKVACQNEYIITHTKHIGMARVKRTVFFRASGQLNKLKFYASTDRRFFTPLQENTIESVPQIRPILRRLTLSRCSFSIGFRIWSQLKTNAWHPGVITTDNCSINIMGGIERIDLENTISFGEYFRCSYRWLSSIFRTLSLSSKDQVDNWLCSFLPKWASVWRDRGEASWQQEKRNGGTHPRHHHHRSDRQEQRRI